MNVLTKDLLKNNILKLCFKIAKVICHCFSKLKIVNIRRRWTVYWTRTGTVYRQSVHRRSNRTPYSGRHRRMYSRELKQTYKYMLYHTSVLHVNYWQIEETESKVYTVQYTVHGNVVQYKNTTKYYSTAIWSCSELNRPVIFFFFVIFIIFSI